MSQNICKGDQCLPYHYVKFKIFASELHKTPSDGFVYCLVCLCVCSSITMVCITVVCVFGWSQSTSRYDFGVFMVTIRDKNDYRIPVAAASQPIFTHATHTHRYTLCVFELQEEQKNDHSNYCIKRQTNTRITNINK